MHRFGSSTAHRMNYLLVQYSLHTVSAGHPFFAQEFLIFMGCVDPITGIFSTLLTKCFKFVNKQPNVLQNCTRLFKCSKMASFSRKLIIWQRRIQTEFRDVQNAVTFFKNKILSHYNRSKHLFGQQFYIKTVFLCPLKFRQRK